MEDTRNAKLPLENQPNSSDIQFLEERIHDFNVQATGISDGALFGVFLRGTDGAVIGGADGWTWGGTCYIRHLFVPAPIRKQGHGARLMARIEEEAKVRQCEQIVLETHDFQAPGFYRKLGFRLIATIDEYPRGHQQLKFMKQVGGPAAEPAEL
jgi:GNAT superfamily N-acetyltransferase